MAMIADQIQQLRMKRLIQDLEAAEGKGTSMISLQSVQSAIKSTQERLKRFSKLPANGLVIFSGLATVKGDKERQMTVDLEPLRPVKSYAYNCNNRFYTEPLKQLFVDESEKRFGVIVVNGSGTLFGEIQGSSRQVLREFSVDLPNKHSRGGQSQNRFARLRDEARRSYLRKVAETSAALFISKNTSRPNVEGIIVAGSAGIKDDLLKSNLFDKRLAGIVVKSLDIASGGQRGFAQAVEDSVEVIGSQTLLAEKEVLARFMEEVSRDAGMYCFSAHDTLRALEMGAVHVLIVCDENDIMRYNLVNEESGEHKTVCLSQAQGIADRVRREVDDINLKVVKEERLVDWLCDNYEAFGCRLELVSSQTGLGTQFLQGFGGLGGLLRWKIDPLWFDESDVDVDDGEPDFEAFWTTNQNQDTADASDNEFMF